MARRSGAHPEIVQLLMNAEFRKEQLKLFPAKAPRPNGASRSHPQYTLNDIAIITSAGPATTPGSCSEGHLGPGADADVAIFNENANAAEMFSYPRYVIKSGQLIVEEGASRLS